MASGALKWSERLLSGRLQHIGLCFRTRETNLMPPRRSFFTVLGGNTAAQANLDPSPIAFKFSERNAHVQDMLSTSSHDALRPPEAGHRKQRSAVCASTDLAELLGCDPHQFHGSHIQGNMAKRTELKSTIKATPISSRDGLAHNVIFE